MTSTVLAISAAYVVMGVLLLAMGLTARFAWWVKATAIVVTSVFFVEAFFATKDLLGWPGSGPLPATVPVAVDAGGRARSARSAIAARSISGSRRSTRTTCRSACRAPFGCPIRGRSPIVRSRRATRSCAASRRRAWPRTSPAPRPRRRPRPIKEQQRTPRRPRHAHHRHGAIPDAAAGAARAVQADAGPHPAPEGAVAKSLGFWAASCVLRGSPAAGHRQERLLDGGGAGIARRAAPASCRPAPCRDAARSPGRRRRPRRTDASPTAPRPRAPCACVSSSLSRSLRLCGSRPTVGSSISRTRGSCSSARASSTRRRLPPQSCAVLSWARSSSPSRASSCAMRALATAARNAVQPGVEHQVGGDRELEVERRLLEHDAEPRQRRHRVARHVVAHHLDAAGIGGEQAGEQLEQRRSCRRRSGRAGR